MAATPRGHLRHFGAIRRLSLELCPDWRSYGHNAKLVDSSSEHVQNLSRQNRDLRFSAACATLALPRRFALFDQNGDGK
jgi:hypothetical protein